MESEKSSLLISHQGVARSYNNIKVLDQPRIVRASNINNVDQTTLFDACARRFNM